MRTVGEILKKAREEKLLSFDEIEKQLRIRKKFLSALENNDWNNLPSLPYIKGFIRNYSKFLDLNPDEMVAIFRRQYTHREKTGLLPKGVTTPLNETPFRITPQLTVISLTIIFITIFFGYLFLQYQSITGAPMLIVTKPLEGEIIYTENVDITGKTDADAVISINNQKVALMENGQFKFTSSMTPGINTIIIESTGNNGKKKTVTRIIQVQTNQ
jgi:hypothetical protein